MRTSLIVLMAFAVFATPLYADVIPSRRAKAPTDGAKVAERVATLGVQPAAAKSETVELTASDRAFFAAHPERVQVVGAQQDMFSGESNNLWFETIVGGFWLAIGVGLIAYMMTNNE